MCEGGSRLCRGCGTTVLHPRWFPTGFPPAGRPAPHRQSIHRSARAPGIPALRLAGGSHRGADLPVTHGVSLSSCAFVHLSEHRSPSVTLGKFSLVVHALGTTLLLSGPLLAFPVRAGRPPARITETLPVGSLQSLNTMRANFVSRRQAFPGLKTPESPLGKYSGQFQTIPSLLPALLSASARFHALHAERQLLSPSGHYGRLSPPSCALGTVSAHPVGLPRMASICSRQRPRAEAARRPGKPSLSSLPRPRRACLALLDLPLQEPARLSSGVLREQRLVPGLSAPEPRPSPLRALSGTSSHGGFLNLCTAGHIWDLPGPVWAYGGNIP